MPLFLSESERAKNAPDDKINSFPFSLTVYSSILSCNSILCDCSTTLDSLRVNCLSYLLRVARTEKEEEARND